MARFVLAIVVALWVCVIALVAAQNGAPVSLRFLGFQSIQIPLGVLLAFCVAIGIVGMVTLLPLWSSTTGRSLRDHEDFE